MEQLITPAPNDKRGEEGTRRGVKAERALQTHAADLMASSEAVASRQQATGSGKRLQERHPPIHAPMLVLKHAALKRHWQPATLVDGRIAVNVPLPLSGQVICVPGAHELLVPGPHWQPGCAGLQTTTSVTVMVVPGIKLLTPVTVAAGHWLAAGQNSLGKGLVCTVIKMRHRTEGSQGGRWWKPSAASTGLL